MSIYSYMPLFIGLFVLQLQAFLEACCFFEANKFPERTQIISDQIEWFFEKCLLCCRRLKIY